MIHIHLKHLEFYFCMLKIYNARTDDWFEKGLRIRFGSYVYVLGKGWRNWRNDK